MMWHVLDVRAIWVKEFASALGRQVETLGWLPHLSAIGRLRRREQEEHLSDPPLTVHHFPLQRGFARPAVAWLVREDDRLVARLERRSDDAAASPLVCTSPHYAAAAARWPGPVIYYVTDSFLGYGMDLARLRAYDREMCAAAALVCPNSNRIAHYLLDQAECPAEKLLVVPNATRAANRLPAPLLEPAALPADSADLRRPVAGVIGALAGNMDWELLGEVVRETPWLTWLFVGDVGRRNQEERQRLAQDHLLQHGGRVRFVGYKPYGSLRDYARALDVAVLPYRKREPTYSGSSTRFYEHLAACRPMLATRSFEELLHKEPLLRLVDTTGEMTAALEDLRARGFRDGCEELRWKTSLKETWGERAQAIRSALTERVHRPREASPRLPSLGGTYSGVDRDH